MATIVGSSARDSIVGTVDDDFIYMDDGGRDTVSGLDGHDYFFFGGELNDNDQIDGGPDSDVLNLEGNYLGGVVFTATTMVNVEEIALMAGFNYVLTLHDATAAGASFNMFGDALGAGHSLVFDGSAETSTSFVVRGGAGDDVLIGGAAGDEFDVDNGGSDTVDGGAGDDEVMIFEELDPGDSIHGGAGVDLIRLIGDYAAGLTITSAMMSGFESIDVSANGLFTLDDDVAPAAVGVYYEMNLLSSVAGQQFLFDVSAETDANWSLRGGASDDTLLGGALDDDLDFDNAATGGIDIGRGGGGDDLIYYDGSLTRDDVVDGGDGFDILQLRGDYGAGLSFRSSTLTDVEQISLMAGFDYSLTAGNNNIRGDGLDVDGHFLGTDDTLYFDATAESATAVTLLGGAGADTLLAGAADDEITGQDGADSLTGGAGHDTLEGGIGRDTLYGGLGTDEILGGSYANTFVYTGVAESTGIGRDWVDVLKPLKDHFDLDVTVTGVDARVYTGSLSLATWDTDLETEIGAGQLAAGHAVVFRPDAGNQSFQFFLIVDANGIDGYQAAEDYVFEFAYGSHPDQIAVGFFI